MARRLLSTAGLLCLLPLLSNAQGRTDYFFHQFNVEIIPRVLAVHPSGRLFSCNGGSAMQLDACETAQVFLWDEHFELETTFWPTLEERWSHLKTAAWHGDTLIALGQPDYCPDSFEERDAFSYLLAYDLAGNFLDGVALPDCETGTPVFFFAERSPSISLPLLDFGPAGEIYVALDDGLLRFPSIRDWPERVAEELELGKLLGLAALPDGRLALCSADSLRLFDPATEEVQWSAPLAAQSMALIDGLLWLASADSLHCLRADESLQAWPLPAEASPWLRLADHAGTPLLYEYYSGVTLHPSYRGWHFSAGSQSFELAFHWANPQIQLHSLQPVGPDTCYVGGLQGGITRPFVKKTAFSALDFSSPFDIGIADLDVEILELDVTYESYYVVLARISIALEYTVENYGAVPVDAFQIDRLMGPAQWCNGPGIRIAAAEGLEPGGRKTYQNNFSYWLNANPDAWPPDSLTFALHTYAPNHHPDGDPTNDHATVRVLLTSAPDQPLAAPHIRLSPNPAQAMVRVESELPLEGFELYDATGRLLRQTELPGGAREFELLRASLPAGLYFLRLRSGGSLWVERVVWQD